MTIVQENSKDSNLNIKKPPTEAQCGSFKSFVQALIKTQAEIGSVEKDGYNPHFKSHYATLDNLLSHIRPILNKNGLALTQTVVKKDGEWMLLTQLLHADLGSHENYYPLMFEKGHPQQMGSAVSYAKRYALSALLAVGSEETDDDGHHAKTDPVRPVINTPKPKGFPSVDTGPDPRIELKRKLKSLASQYQLDLKKEINRVLNLQLKEDKDFNALTPMQLMDVIQYIEDNAQADLPDFNEKGPVHHG